MIFAVSTVFFRYLQLATQDYLKLTSTDNLMILLEKVLKTNNFDFAGRHFLQVGGTAMGTKVAPSFANTFMGWLESKFF